MKRFLTVIVGVGLLFGSFVFNSPVSAYYTNMPASVVLGQPDFTSGSSGLSASAFKDNDSMVIVNNRLFVADSTNNRVLIWNSIPTQNNTPADVVLGQPDFISSTANNGGISASTLNVVSGVASDGTKLFVADSLNKRVLIWNTLPTSNKQLADVVVGQPDFVTRTDGVTASKMSTTQYVLSFNGKLVVSENNRRVLIWNSIPTTNGAPADVVIGQTDMTTGSFGGLDAAHFGTAISANTRGIAVYNNKLIVADNSNQRVLIYNSIPTTNGASADVVIGQPNMTSSGADNGGISCATLEGVPGGISVTPSGRLLIPDNGRLLIFNQIPTSNFQTADIVLGKPDCVTRTTGTSTITTGSRIRSVIEFGQKLFVADSNNNRILIFNNIIATPEISMTGITKTTDLKLKISGNIKVGEAGHYDLGGGGGISYSINGSDGAGVNTIGNQVNDGSGSLYYDFSNTFEPWINGNGIKDDWINNFDFVRGSRGFTVKVTSRNSNTDSSRIFYFEPFKIVSFSPSVSRFSVNKYQVQTIKDNVDHFEIWVRPTFNTTNSSSASTGSSLPSSPTSSWTKYLDGITTDKIDVTTGEVVVSTTSLTQFPLISLLKGKYDVKVVSVSKDSNFRQDSQNTISQTFDSPTPLVSYINPNNYQATTNPWFPLQLEKALGTNMGLISSFNLGSVSTFPYISQDLSLRLSGTSFAGSTVAVRVTDTTSGSHKDFLTTTNKDSTFTIFHTLYPTSILTISTYDTNGHFNLLPLITVTTNQ